MHLPILTFLVDLGFYEPARQKPVAIIIAWVVLEALGTLCILYSAPVNRFFNALTNLWYRPRSKRI